MRTTSASAVIDYGMHDRHNRPSSRLTLDSDAVTVTEGELQSRLHIHDAITGTSRRASRLMFRASLEQIPKLCQLLRGDPDAVILHRQQQHPLFDGRSDPDIPRTPPLF